MVIPNYVKEVQLTNQSPHKCTITVSFGSQYHLLEEDGEEYIIIEKVVEPKEMVYFPEQHRNMGTWEAVVPVYCIKINNGIHDLSHFPKAVGVVQMQKYDIMLNQESKIMLEKK